MINNNNNIDQSKDAPNSSPNDSHVNNNKNLFRFSLEDLGLQIRNLGEKKNRRVDSVINNNYYNSNNESSSAMSCSSHDNLSKSKKKINPIMLKSKRMKKLVG